MKDLLLDVEKQFTGILAGKTSLAHPGSFVHRMFRDFRNPGIVKAMELLVEFSLILRSLVPKGEVARVHQRVIQSSGPRT